MNRELKFKVWVPYRNIMMDARSIQTIHESVLGGVTIGELKQWIYLQFTGLHDKNGVEIYEGDIIGVGKNADVVKFKCGTFSVYDQPLGWEVEDFDADSLPYERDTENWAVVTGNIYENPELLNESRHFKPQTAAL